MIVLAMISYAMPELTGRNQYKNWKAEWAFWTTNIGMVGMTGAFAVMGIAQVYLERKAGMDFLLVQESLEVHAVGLVLAAALLTFGVVLYIMNFLEYGRPVDPEEIPTVGGSHEPQPADARKDH